MTMKALRKARAGSGQRVASAPDRATLEENVRRHLYGGRR
jgi:hypothetical protein